MTLPPFPVDDLTLDAIEHALGASLDMEDPAAPKVVGADFSMSSLLDFLSGYDPTQVVPVLDDEGRAIPDTVEYVGGPLYTTDDVIRALVTEVRQLRAERAA